MTAAPETSPPTGSPPSAWASRGAALPDDDPRQVLARPLAATSLLDAVKDLRRDVAATGFPLDLPGAGAARGSRDRLLDQLDEHLVPRLTELSAPAVVVVAGSTGAGKSTLVNSLVGSEVSTAGVLRPTTRQPVLVHHPLDTELLSHHPVLESVQVVADEHVPRGIAVLDAPDLDSVLESNRESAHRLLEAADLWLFVTTAARYGDALPWRVLEQAVQRGASIAMVLNRVPTASLPTVRGDLLGRLREHGLQGSPLFVVPDVGPHVGMLEPHVVAPIHRWLVMLAGPDRARTVVGRTLRGSLTALREWVDELAEAVQQQSDAAAELGRRVDAAADEAVGSITIAQGAAVDGAVRGRWAELTAPGGVLDGLVRRSGRVRASRGSSARQEALAALVTDLTHAAATALGSVGDRARDAMRASVAGTSAPPGAAALARAWEARAAGSTSAEQAARGWVAQGPRVVRAALAAGPRRETPDGAARRLRDVAREARQQAAALRALGDEGLGAVALAAAVGFDEARALLEALLGSSSAGVVRELRDDLATRATAQVAGQRAAADEVLADPDLAPDAAARLRLRLAVLKGLT